MKYGLMLLMALALSGPAAAESLDPLALQVTQADIDAAPAPAPAPVPAEKSCTPFYKTRTAFYSALGLCALSGVSALVFMKQGNDRYDEYKKAGKGADFDGMKDDIDASVLYNNISFGVFVTTGALSGLLWKIRN